MVSLRERRVLGRSWQAALSLVGTISFLLGSISPVMAGPMGHDLSIALASESETVTTGTLFTVTMTIENHGPMPSTESNVSTGTPSGTTFQSVSTSVGTVDQKPQPGGTGSIEISLGGLAVDQVETVTLELMVTAGSGSTITVSGSVQPLNPSGDANQGNNQDDLQLMVAEAGSADIELALATDDDVAGSGSLFDYEMTVTNLPPAARAERDGATGLYLSGAIPDGAVFSSISSSQGEVTVPEVGETGEFACTLGSLEEDASATVVLTISVTAEPGATLEFSAHVSSDANDPDTSNNSVDASTDVEASGSTSLDWDEPDDPTEAVPFPPPQHLVIEDGARPHRENDARPAQGGSVVGYKVYRSNRPNVTPTPGNLFTTVPAAQTNSSAAVAPSGSFFTVTAVYGSGESGPSNETSAAIPAATLTKVKVKSTKVTATGSSFSDAVTVFIDGIPFASPASVKKSNTKVIQKGNLITGESIGAYLASHPSVLITFRNSNGGVASYRHP